MTQCIQHIGNLIGQQQMLSKLHSTQKLCSRDLVVLGISLYLIKGAKFGTTDRQLLVTHIGPEISV